jgi:hypothetical protein
MLLYDSTQVVLSQYLNNTEQLMNKLLTKEFAGVATIRVASDLGFPHDVIRIAGGFATGAYVEWTSNIPFVPVDTCVNVCTASFFEVHEDISEVFNEENLTFVKNRLAQGIYISNFHRGNHFIAYLKSINTGKRYLLLHSSANEFKENFNGLYPIEGNWYFDKIKTFSDGHSYLRYLDGREAEVFCSVAEGLYRFNEIRHEFIAHVILADHNAVYYPCHYHHYGMPTNNSVAMGCHLIQNGEIAPVLSLPGENIYMVKFISTAESSLKISESQFLTPHGWGKRHTGTPKISLDLKNNRFSLDDENYEIRFGTSLRAHPNLELRDFETNSSTRKENFFSLLSSIYNYEVTDEFEQIASWNKAGVKRWK